MDVIASTAFSIKVESQTDFSHPFVKNARDMFIPLGTAVAIFVGICPFLADLMTKLGFGFPPKSAVDFFANNMKDIMKQREQQPNTKRVDFLQLLMDAEITEDSSADDHMANDYKPESHVQRRLTTDEIVGQGSLFFVAGYETTASTLNFASFALATNPDVQEKAYQEIQDVLRNDEPTYDNIGKLKYTECVILETLRLYPPGTVLHRTVSETIELNGIKLPKGWTVMIPVYSIQRDPELFPDPEEFKPERHLNDVNPFSFLSFGFGPRSCIGMLLALVEAKIALIHVLRSVKFEPLPNTPDKMELADTGLLVSVKPNILRVVSRCQETTS